MSIKLKTKLSIGLIFLFLVILLFGILGIANINKLSRDADLVLKNNHESLVYCNSMLKALENAQTQKSAIPIFEENLKKQEENITEIGEQEATNELRKNFDELKANPSDPSNYPEIRQSIIQIQELNELAILRKNAAVQKTAENARLWLTIIFTVLTLIAFTFIYNLPDVISKPITTLSEGIAAIATKDYKKRIYLKQEDEFGDLAYSFNKMAEKLDEYESSNLAKVKFEKSRIETIINQMHDGILGLDDKKNILFLNAVAEKMLGLKETDIAGKYAPDLALKNDLMRTLLRNDQDGIELKIYADNRESYFSKDTLNVTNDKQSIGQVIVLRNITPFHELNEAKTNFIATVSHELKTPISSIKMSAQLLDDERIGKLVPEQKELLKSIREDAERLLRITGELLNMAQVETGNIQIKMLPSTPQAIVQQAIQAVQFQAQQKSLSLRTAIDENLPAVLADMDKTAWVLTNFLTNAIKFSPEGGNVDIKVNRTNGNIEFSVLDRGNGIEEEYLPRIFDRFFKVPGRQDGSGTGLGLSISKEFMEAQGGQIWVRSKPGEGSQFGFSLKTA
ncbi:MAG: ATP-binding protein [Chitinophagales bacterium]